MENVEVAIRRSYTMVPQHHTMSCDDPRNLDRSHWR